MRIKIPLIGGCWKEIIPVKDDDMASKKYYSLSDVQKELLYELIQRDPESLDWEKDGYKLSAWYIDEESNSYTITLYYNNGYLIVIGEHRLGIGSKNVWNQEGEKIEM